MTTLEDLENAGHGAVVAHPTDFEWYPVVKIDDMWFETTLDMAKTSEDLMHWIRTEGFELVYEGLK